MIKIYTDGSCIGNPGKGGWAAIILDDGKKTEIKGSKNDTTNNQMELLAPIKALKEIPKGSKVRCNIWLLVLTNFHDATMFNQMLRLFFQIRRS